MASFVSKSLCLFVLAACSLAARADTVPFNVTGSVAGLSLGGTLTINTTTGSITGSDITAGSMTFTNASQDNNYGGMGYTLIFDSNAGNTAELNFILYQSLVGITGASTYAANFYYPATTTYSGEGSLFLALPPVTPTPESSSILLFGTGLLGAMVFAFRRRNLFS